MKREKVLTLWIAVVVLFSAALILAPNDALAAKKPQYGTVGTFLSKLYAGDGLDAKNAYLDNPEGFTADANCSLTIADTLNNVIRRVDGTTNAISTLAGNGNFSLKNGVASSAAFRWPNDVELGPSGEAYIVDTENNSVRVVRDGAVSTWLTGLKRPIGSTIDGSTLYLGDTGNNRILKATVPGGGTTVVTNIATPGKMVVFDGSLYVVHSNNTALSRVTISTGTIMPIKEGLTNLDGVAVYNGKIYFVAGNFPVYDDVWRYDPATGEQTLLVHVVETELYNHASDILFCNDKMYLLFVGGSSVYTLNPDGTNPARLAGVHRYGDTDGLKDVAVLGRPKALVLSKDKQKLYILENHRFKVYNLATETLSFVAGSPMDNWRDDIGVNARLSGATQAALSPDGTRIWFADRNNNRVRSLIIDEARLTTLTGAGATNQATSQNNGYAEGTACSTEEKGVDGCAYFNRPTGIAISKDGKTLYIADSDNNRIRTVDIATGDTSLLVGGSKGFKNGIGRAVKFKSPTSLLLSTDGERLYVVDYGNHAIRQIDLRTKRVTTLMGSGRAGYRDGSFKSARLSYPDSLVQGTSSNILYLSEIGSQRIRKIDLKKKEISLAAGSGQRGFVNGQANKAAFNNPKGMAVLNGKTILVADLLNDLIRVVRLP